MLRMSWIKCPLTGKLRAYWIRTANPTPLAGLAVEETKSDRDEGWRRQHAGSVETNVL